MGDAGIPISDLVERLKLEIARLSDELRKTLEDSIYMPMNASQNKDCEKKCKDLNRLVQEVAELVQLQHMAHGQNGVISPQAASSDLPPVTPNKPAKNEA